MKTIQLADGTTVGSFETPEDAEAYLAAKIARSVEPGQFVDAVVVDAPSADATG